jgi:hypothetical protein
MNLINKDQCEELKAECLEEYNSIMHSDMVLLLEDTVLALADMVSFSSSSHEEFMIPSEDECKLLYRD